MKTFQILRAGAVSKLAPFFVLLFIAAVSADAQTYQGQATAAKVSVTAPLITPTVVAVADTGPLPSAGGTISLSSAGTNLAGVVTVGASNVSTSGSTGATASTASVGTVNVSVLGNTISADIIQASANASCPGAITSGSATITNLVITGGSITVTGDANQTIALPGAVGNVVLNEHVIEVGVETVNAIHIHVTALDLTVTDVVIASARAGIDCGFAPTADLFGGYGKSVTLRQGLGLPPAIVDTFLTDTGWLPRSGGVINTSTVAAGLSSILTTGASSSSTSGGPAAGTPRATASNSHVDQLGINVLSGVVTISALTVNSDTSCSCDSNNASSCTGSSQLTNLNVNVLGLNVPVTITGLPNQVVNIPVLGFGNVTLTINERISSGTGDLTVNALRVDLTLTGLASTRILVSSAHSDIVCKLGVTAAPVSLSGRVLDANGRQVSNAIVSVTDNTGFVRSTRTNTFGYYSFSNLTAGQSYLVRVTSKTAQYAPRLFSAMQDYAGFDLYPSGAMKSSTGIIVTDLISPVKTVKTESIVSKKRE
jgi:hypothetical protein